MKRKEKIQKIVIMVVCDLLLLAAALLSFAYFHHVRIAEIEPQVIERPAAPATEVPMISSTPEPVQTTTPAEGETPPPTPEPTPEPSGLLRGQYSDKFSAEIVQTDESYRSPGVAVEMITLEMYDSIVHVADIYINDITSLRTGVFSDYDDGFMHTLAMTKETGGVVGLSGDHFYAHIQSGVFAIRNGKLYAEKPNSRQDACVLYYDGTMEVYTASEIDLEAIYARDPYQVWYFGPGLLDDEGNAIETFTDSVADVNPRSAIGYFEPGHYCFVMVEGRQKDSDGVTLADLANIFEELGCKAAYNLDGGKTATIVWNGKLKSRLLGSGRTVSDILYIAEPLTATTAEPISE